MFPQGRTSTNPRFQTPNSAQMIKLRLWIEALPILSLIWPILLRIDSQIKILPLLIKILLIKARPTVIKILSLAIRAQILAIKTKTLVIWTKTRVIKTNSRTIRANFFNPKTVLTKTQIITQIMVRIPMQTDQILTKVALINKIKIPTNKTQVLPITILLISIKANQIRITSIKPRTN